MVIQVLVVDDGETILNTFVDLLEAYKINVVGTAKNGEDAVEQFKKLSPDVTFLDIMMPEFDGHYALQEIRSISKTANVIMVTGGGDEEIEKLSKFNPSYVIHKPFQMCTLLHVLKNELKLEIDSN
ncbi:Stage 0 sporulation protein A [Marine Group I thaumarchaeote SCGC AAA799-E16]|uniref:Chemotaxis response regulator protein-glutamate methylesterase n=2 Tax=Marine Group I TaxID=905826 RepID=A0A087RZQ5_9ARCH|nr:Stage 0 sporulation protein A [Marine Group I thaumarchaeote SCGC AAA799-E16]KFM18959.1 Chemotaxis response regulator protein-glutamate methylesterase [Marine Group I thaumarchaeote SCGC RSA3]